MAQLAIEPLNDRRRRLYLDRNQFDDYLIALNAQLRTDEHVDRILSGQDRHPLEGYQLQFANALNQLRIPYIAPRPFVEDPFGVYKRFSQQLVNSLAVARSPIPYIGDLNQLDVDYLVHKAAQKSIYATIVRTLEVDKTMHYARQVMHGAGVHLLNVIIADNRQTTTRSLMAVFSALLGLRLKPGEIFEQFSRRLDLLIQRLNN